MKSLLKTVLVSTALMSFASIASAAETVVWWDFLGGGDGVRMKKLIEDFNAEHAGKIEIQGTTLDWGVPFYTKVQTSAAVGEGPDVMTYHASRIPLAVSQGTLSEITAEDWAAMGLSADTFAQQTWDAVNVDGKQYAVPFDTHPIVLYYNKDKLEAAGLIGADGLPTGLDGIDNFKAALQKIKDGGTTWGVQLGTQFRYLLDSGRGNLEFSYLPSDDLTDREREQETAEFIERGYPLANRRGDDRTRFHFDGRQDLFAGWEARANLNWISDPRVLEDFSNNVDGLAPYSLISRLGIYGDGRWWNAGIAADHNELADYTLSETALPHDRLPRAWLDWEQPFAPWFRAGINAEAVRFHHAAEPGGSRIDLKPYASMPLQGASWFLTPKLSWRYTRYRLDDALAAQLGDDAPTRSLPIASLDGGLFFDRETRIGGENFLQTLEPRLFYLRVPYRDQDGLPRFDTRPLTFSWGQLFRENRYTGADRQTDANQLTLAVSTRLLRQSDGREKLSASVGQIRYFDESRVTVPGETPVERGKSAWVADASYAVNDRWSLGASYQWDPKFRRKDLASVRTRYLVGDTGVVNLSYRYRRDVLEQVDLNFLYPLTPSWSVVGRYYHSLEDKQLLEGIAGLQWDSCCMAVRLVGRRYVHNREGDLNNSIQFEVELKGLGSAGPDTESRLRRAILGYYREDLYLVPPSDDDGADDSLDLMP